MNNYFKEFLELPLNTSELAEDIRFDRSLTFAPEATINTSTLQLSVTYYSPLDSYTLYVYDAMGNVVYQELVISDGMKHYYQLPVLEDGSYEVSISSDSVEYIGTFSI